MAEICEYGIKNHTPDFCSRCMRCTPEGFTNHLSGAKGVELRERAASGRRLVRRNKKIKPEYALFSGKTVVPVQRDTPCPEVAKIEAQGLGRADMAIFEQVRDEGRHLLRQKWGIVC